jgi:hypothetical protein
MIGRMEKKVDRLMAGGMNTGKIIHRVLRWADGWWRGYGKPEWMNPKDIENAAIAYIEKRRKQVPTPTVVLRKAGESTLRRDTAVQMRPPVPKTIDHATWVCGSCLREYKKSAEGRLERKKFLRGDFSAAWNHGRWPFWVYHDNGRGLCVKHRDLMKFRMICRYRTRNEIVIALGFKGYNDYLKSDLWKAIRQRCFDTFGKLCHFCGNTAMQIHHDRYDERVIMGEDLSALYPVCGSCHTAGEYARNGDKLPPETATGKMRDLGFAAGHAKHIQEMNRIRFKLLRSSSKESVTAVVE